MDIIFLIKKWNISNKKKISMYIEKLGWFTKKRFLE
jgi:hypothetical protein